MISLRNGIKEFADEKAQERRRIWAPGTRATAKVYLARAFAPCPDENEWIGFGRGGVKIIHFRFNCRVGNEESVFWQAFTMPKQEGTRAQDLEILRGLWKASGLKRNSDWREIEGREVQIILGSYTNKRGQTRQTIAQILPS